jgi:CBS domain-containing protein
MRKTVRDVMTPKPRAVARSSSVGDAARLMQAEDVGSLPVVEAGDVLVGIVTDRDIAIRVVAAGKDPSSTRVADVLTESPSCAYPDEPLDEALEQMAYRRVRRLPVVEDDRLVGILAQADVVHEVKDKTAGQLVEEISQPAAEALLSVRVRRGQGP